MKLRTLLVTVLALMMSVLATSCVKQAEARREGCKIKVGIVFDIGGKNDRSFNAAAWEGVRRAEKDLSVCLYDVEPGNPTSIEPARWPWSRGRAISRLVDLEAGERRERSADASAGRRREPRRGADGR